jgi:hypothetical protein
MMAEQQDLINTLRLMPNHTSDAVELALATKRSVLNVASDLRLLASERIVEAFNGSSYRLLEQRHLWE